MNISFNPQNETISEWINKQLLNSTDPLQDSSLVLNQVQLLSSTLSVSLQQLTLDSLNKLEKINGYISNCQTASQNLSLLLSKASNDLNSNSSSLAFTDLIELDSVRRNMEITRDSLKEAENWNSLEMEMDAILVSKDYAKAAKRLQEASQSLSLLSATHEYQSRKAVLEKFQNDLQKLLVLSLKEAVLSMNSEQVVHLNHLYKLIQRESEYNDTLNHIKTQDLIQKWTEFDSDSKIRIAMTKPCLEGQDSPLIEWMNQFYSHVYTQLSKDYTWLKTISFDSQSNLMSLVGFLFVNLRPTMKDRWLKLLKDHGPMFFPTLVQVYEKSVHFGCKMESLMLFKDSKDSKEVKELKETEMDQGTWGLSLFESFLPLQVDYASYERNSLLSILNETFMDNRKQTNYLVFSFF